MADLLTARQLQDLLRIDRTTIYRMLADGRLKGVKVGNQWRFPKEAVDALISGVRTDETERLAPSHQVLPLNCIQPIQDVFADITQVSSLTTAPDGTPLTRLSSPCAFCTLILGSPSGKQACIASWQKLATQPEVRPRFVTCHAGLHYARARIEIGGTLVAMVVAGQFYASTPDPSEERQRIRSLAATHGIRGEALDEASRSIPVVDARKVAQIGTWMEKIAGTFEHFGKERSEMLSRLRRIADITALDAP
jgi:excisionase family DNA binding protein